MFKKLNVKYTETLITAIAVYLVWLTAAGYNKIEFFVTYPIHNIKLDSLQENRIKNLEISSVNFVYKKESRASDSLIFLKLDYISKQQKVFQNKVIDRYDEKCDILTENQREIIGVLKALKYLSVNINDTVNLMSKDVALLNHSLTNIIMIDVAKKDTLMPANKNRVCQDL